MADKPQLKERSYTPLQHVKKKGNDAVLAEYEKIVKDEPVRQEEYEDIFDEIRDALKKHRKDARKELIDNGVIDKNDRLLGYATIDPKKKHPEAGISWRDKLAQDAVDTVLLYGMEKKFGASYAKEIKSGLKATKKNDKGEEEPDHKRRQNYHIMLRDFAKNYLGGGKKGYYQLVSEFASSGNLMKDLRKGELSKTIEGYTMKVHQDAGIMDDYHDHFSTLDNTMWLYNKNNSDLSKLGMRHPETTGLEGLIQTRQALAINPKMVSPDEYPVEVLPAEGKVIKFENRKPKEQPKELKNVA